MNGHDRTHSFSQIDDEINASSAPDELTLEGELDLQPKQRAIYYSRQLLGMLKKDNHNLKFEHARLRPIEIEHAKLLYSRGWQKWLSTISGLSVLGSGAILSQCTSTGALGLGWGLCFLAASSILGNAVIRPTIPKA